MVVSPEDYKKIFETKKEEVKAQEETIVLEDLEDKLKDNLGDK